MKKSNNKTLSAATRIIANSLFSAKDIPEDNLSIMCEALLEVAKRIDDFVPHSADKFYDPKRWYQPAA